MPWFIVFLFLFLRCFLFVFLFLRHFFFLSPFMFVVLPLPLILCLPLCSWLLLLVFVGFRSSSSSHSLGNLLRGKWSLPSQVVFVEVLNDYLLLWCCCMIVLLYVIGFWCLLLLVLMLVFFKLCRKKCSVAKKNSYGLPICWFYLLFKIILNFFSFYFW